MKDYLEHRKDDEGTDVLIKTYSNPYSKILEIYLYQDNDYNEMGHYICICIEAEDELELEETIEGYIRDRLKCKSEYDIITWENKIFYEMEQIHENYMQYVWHTRHQNKTQRI